MVQQQRRRSSIQAAAKGAFRRALEPLQFRNTVKSDCLQRSQSTVYSSSVSLPPMSASAA